MQIAVGKDDRLVVLLCFILCFIVAQNHLWKIYGLYSFFPLPLEIEMSGLEKISLLWQWYEVIRHSNVSTLLCS